MSKTKAKTAVLADRSPQRLTSRLRPASLALLGVARTAAAGPCPGHRARRQQGAHEGNRVAGPVGGVVGGAVGAGVGGAVGAVEGVFGVPHQLTGHYRCRGYCDRYGHFHCYR